MIQKKKGRTAAVTGAQMDFWVLWFGTDKGCSVISPRGFIWVKSTKPPLAQLSLKAPLCVFALSLKSASSPLTFVPSNKYWSSELTGITSVRSDVSYLFLSLVCRFGAFPHKVQTAIVAGLNAGSQIALRHLSWWRRSHSLPAMLPPSHTFTDTHTHTCICRHPDCPQVDSWGFNFMLG